MVQFNLLPDIKIQYLKAKRQKHLVMLVSSITTAASLAVLTIMLGIAFFAQQKSISDLSQDIDTVSREIQSTPELNKILTVQSQLNSLPSLHDAKPEANRLFSYISQITPTEANLSNLRIDFDESTITLDGKASSLEVVNKFTDTIKFTSYTLGTGGEIKAFSSVVLDSFSRSDNGANFSILFSFDPVIFDSTQNVVLSVPSIVSTRSQTEQPTALFQEEGEEER